MFRSGDQQITPDKILNCHLIQYEYVTFLGFDDVISTVSLTCDSLHIPDLTKQRGKLVIVHSPGREHLGVVVAERPQLRQAAQETGEVLWLMGMVENAHLPQQVQCSLLETLNSWLILNIRSVWTGREPVRCVEPASQSEFTDSSLPGVRMVMVVRRACSSSTMWSSPMLL